MKINALSTGSSGNSFIIDKEDKKNTTQYKNYILIDCGFSYKQLTVILQEQHIYFSQISHLIITHEHSDHIKGLKQIIKLHPQITIILSKGTFLGLKSVQIEIKNYIIISPNEKVILNNIEIIGVEKEHDGIEPLSLILVDINTKKKIAIFNDLGEFNVVHTNMLKQCNIIFLECNYDEELIKNSTMHYSYLNRIQSPKGHLSNSQAQELCSHFLQPNQTIILSHISENVNSYFLAYSKLSKTISKKQIENPNLKNITLLTSFQLTPTGWID